MGGTPITALSILCYPAKDDIETLRAILEGGAAKLIEADCALLGGHSVADDAVKFGYSITGLVHPQRFRANAHARPGDALVLTKPLGTGVIATAHKRGLARAEDVDAATRSMLTLNRAAAAAMSTFDVHGCTDITGFGLLGHAREMALASRVTLEISAAAAPFLAGALEAVAAGAVPGGLENNRAFASTDVHVAANLDQARLTILYDPQTSGGLLITLPPDDAKRLCDAIPASIIGQVVVKKEKALWIL